MVVSVKSSIERTAADSKMEERAGCARECGQPVLLKAVRETNA